MADDLVGAINGYVVSLTMLVDRLEASGAINKHEYVADLRRSVEIARGEPTERRVDLFVIEQIANACEMDPTDPGRPGWIPKVIEGGKSPHSPIDESH